AALQHHPEVSPSQRKGPKTQRRKAASLRLCVFASLRLIHFTSKIGTSLNSIFPPALRSTYRARPACSRFSILILSVTSTATRLASQSSVRSGSVTQTEGFRITSD